MTRPKRYRGEGFTLIELLIVIIIIGILAAIAIPMFLGQRDKAKESAVKGGVHNIELGIGSYAVDNQDLYPANGGVSAGTLGSYVDNWPKNPWTNQLMAQAGSLSKGDYNYTNSGTTFTLVGWGKNSGIFTAP
jgi:type II secretion system protein G